MDFALKTANFFFSFISCKIASFSLILSLRFTYTKELFRVHKEKLWKRLFTNNMKKEIKITNGTITQLSEISLSKEENFLDHLSVLEPNAKLNRHLYHNLKVISNCLIAFRRK
jgi:hypothetical protein